MGFLIVVALIVFYFVSIYNGLVRMRNRVKEAWSDIEVQMKRRYDLIPNLVETVKGYAAHEKGTLDAVISARNSAMQNSGSPQDQAKDERTLAGALKSVFALAESYPYLKANQNFLELQKELTNTEDRIQSSRRFYNSAVMDLNTAIEVFPKNLVAQRFNFTKSEFFELDEAERKEAEKPVKVSF